MKRQTQTGSSFNKRITIQAPNTTINSDGGSSAPTWSTVSGCDSVPACFTYPLPSKRGDEIFNLQQEQEAVFVTITIRYRPSCNIAPSYQVVYGTRVFNIRTVFVDGESQRIIMMQCQELQAKGTLHS